MAPSRDVKQYEEHIEELHQQRENLVKAGKDLNKIQAICGIQEDSALNETPHYSPFKNDTGDTLHDVLEDHGNFAFKLATSKIIETNEHDFVEGDFNNRIETFDYGQAEKPNKPSANITKETLQKVLKEHKFKQRGGQLRCFFRVFPFLVSDIVPSDDPYLQFVLKYNRICELVFAPKIRKSSLSYLHELIRQHCNEFKILFPEANPIILYIILLTTLILFYDQDLCRTMQHLNMKLKMDLFQNMVKYVKITKTSQNH